MQRKNEATAVRKKKFPTHPPSLGCDFEAIVITWMQNSMDIRVCYVSSWILQPSRGLLKVDNPLYLFAVTLTLSPLPSKPTTTARFNNVLRLYICMFDSLTSISVKQYTSFISPVCTFKKKSYGVQVTNWRHGPSCPGMLLSFLLLLWGFEEQRVLQLWSCQKEFLYRQNFDQGRIHNTCRFSSMPAKIEPPSPSWIPLSGAEDDPPPMSFANSNWMPWVSISWLEHALLTATSSSFQKE